ncbi:MAG: phage holin family protein [Myxococcota bacterium]
MPTPPDPTEQPQASAPVDGAANAADPTDGMRSRFAPYLKILRWVIRSFTGFFQAHVMVIRAEAGNEAIRVASGVLLLLGAGVSLFITALLGGVAIVGLIQRLSGLPWLESLGLAMAATGSVALVLVTIAWLLLRRPLLPKSRKLLKSTFDGFTGG